MTRPRSTAVARPLPALLPHRLSLLFVASMIALISMIAHARAVDIQPFETPAGLSVWLVEDHTVPIIAVDFAFSGGSAQDPDGKEGLTNLLSTTLDEGAGDLTSRAFQERMQDLAVKIGFDAGRDAFYGSLRTLTPNAEDAFEMLRLAVTEPRFDADAVERMRSQIIAGLRREAKDPDAIAARTFARTVFPGHPYGRPANGTEETVSALTPADLKAQHQRLFAQSSLQIAVVGAIDAATLGPLLDRVFAALPAEPDLMPVAEITPRMDIEESVTLDVPQTAIRIGLPGLKRDDPDFIPAYVMNHILGGGSFSSWLYDEVREKRGLAYSVGSYLVPYDHAGMLIAATGTRADRASETLQIIGEQMGRMASQGPTEEELAKAKSFLTGSYALRFDTSGKIANQLLGIRMEKLGLDYIDKRNGLIEAVTLEDIKRVANRLLGSASPTIVTVGPEQPS